MHFERELKLNLENESNYHKILTFWGYTCKETHQLNVFYDTGNSLLKKRKLALRIRKENSKYTLTAKGANLSHDEYVTRPEIECFLPRATAEAIFEKKKNISELDEKPVRWIRKQLNNRLPFLIEVIRFENLRQEMKVPLENQMILFHLDKTSYSDDVTDYELEIEFPAKDSYASSKLFIEKILKKASIPWKTSVLSKYERGLQIQERTEKPITHL